MKTPTILKRQWFGDIGNDKTEMRRSKRQRLDEHNNEKGNDLDNKEKNSLDNDKGEIEDSRYISLLFIFHPPFFQKVSNRPSDLG